ncbi:MAG: head GIN domain-containing protein [Bacteroidota bacterium]
MKNKSFLLRSLFCLFLAISIASVSAQRVEGNKNVVEQDREHTGFTSIEIERGVDLYLEQGNRTSVTVKADENLVDMIKTKVDGNTLKVTTTNKGIYNYESCAVHVVVKDLNQIIATGGSDIYGVNTIQQNELRMRLTGGSDVEMELDLKTLHCKLTGGSDAEFKGQVNHMIVEARGGSDLEAKRLTVNKCELDVRGGSDAHVHVKEELDARATGASDIYYSGNPSVVHEKARGSSDIHSN